MNLQNRKRLTDLENDLMVSGGEGEVRDFGKVMYTLLYLKWIINKDLWCSTWNSAQCYVPAWMGGVAWRRTDTCICMAKSLHCSPETTKTLSISHTPLQKRKLKEKKKKIYPSNTGGAEGIGLIPGQRAKIRHTSRSKNQNTKQQQYCNKLNKDFKNGPRQKKNNNKVLKKIKETHLAAVERPLSTCSHLLHCSSFTSLITRTAVIGRWPAGISFLAFIIPFPASPLPEVLSAEPLQLSPKNDVIIAVMIYKLPACQALC